MDFYRISAMKPVCFAKRMVYFFSSFHHTHHIFYRLLIADYPGLVVTLFDRAARTDVVEADSKCSGIWPVNRFAIDDSVFAPAKTF